MKNELLFELNNVIVSLENNNRFSEANILNREFVKIAQNQQFLNELENVNEEVKQKNEIQISQVKQVPYMIKKAVSEK